MKDVFLVFFSYVDRLADVAKKLGFDDDMAYSLAYHTVKTSYLMLFEGVNKT